MKIASDLDELAQHIAKKAIDDDTAFAEKLDAFGKLTAYYALLLKTRRNLEDGDEPTMDSFQDKLREAEQEEPDGGQREPVARLPARRRSAARP